MPWTPEALSALLQARGGRLGGVSPETARAMLATGRVTPYEKGAFVTRKGQREPRLCFVLSGVVRLTAFTEDGREMLTLILKPGDCWGVSPCLGRYRETNDGVLEGRGEVLSFKPHEVEDLMWKRQDFQKLLVAVLCHRLNLSVRLAQQIGSWNARQRVAWRLLLTANELDSGQRSSAEVVLSQESLASMVSLSRQRTNHVLKTLEEDGLIALAYGRIRIHDTAALQAICEPSE